jgi:hypothetical protein
MVRPCCSPSIPSLTFNSRPRSQNPLYLPLRFISKGKTFFCSLFAGRLKRQSCPVKARLFLIAFLTLTRLGSNGRKREVTYFPLKPNPGVAEKPAEYPCSDLLHCHPPQPRGALPRPIRPLLTFGCSVALLYISFGHLCSLRAVLSSVSCQISIQHIIPLRTLAFLP